MLIYLVRHGEAKDSDHDPERGLSPEGETNVCKAGVFLSTKNLRVGRICHSSKKRAQETADILGSYMGPANGVSQEKGLEPEDDPTVWNERLKNEEQDIMLVGHMPHLDRLASLLVSGDSEKHAVKFSPSEVVCIVKTGSKCSVMWKVSPELL